MKKFIFICVVLAMIVGCTDSDNAVRVLKAQGYTNIKTTGYCFFGCSKDDTVATGFEATAPNGQKVEGVVCQGLMFKGATIRLK
jgi:hypothetical protein